MTPTATIQKGDRFVYPADNPTVFIEVTRVARDGSWADIRCLTWAAMWTKRQPLPMPGKRRDWTILGVEATEPHA